MCQNGVGDQKKMMFCWFWSSMQEPVIIGDGC